MKNPYSIALAVIAVITVPLGLLLMFGGPFLAVVLARPVFILLLPIGLISLVLGLLILTGFRTMNPSPREIGIVTCLGKKRPYKADGLSLTFEHFGMDIVGIVVIKMVPHTQTYTLGDGNSQGILTPGDNVTSKVVIEASWKADERSIEKLLLFDNVGGNKGVEVQLSGIFLTQLQEIAAAPNEDGSLRTSQWMESNSATIGNSLETAVMNGKSKGAPENADAEGFGIVFSKLTLKFTPPPEVIKAREQHQIEMYERESEALEQKTINEQMQAKWDMYHKAHLADPANTPPVSMQQCRIEVVQDRALRAGKMEIVNSTGNVLTLAKVGTP